MRRISRKQSGKQGILQENFCVLSISLQQSQQSTASAACALSLRDLRSPARHYGESVRVERQNQYVSFMKTLKQFLTPVDLSSVVFETLGQLAKILNLITGTTVGERAEILASYIQHRMVTPYGTILCVSN